MANDYTTPGLYVEELSKFPNSIISPETATAIFVGYTRFANNKASNDFLFQPKQIQSLIEYEQFFGKADPPKIFIKTQPAFMVDAVLSSQFLLYQSIQLFFANGGGKCVIISVGDYSSPILVNDFLKGIAVVDSLQNGNLIVFPDAVNLTGNDLYTLQAAALAICGNNKNRFCIVDLKAATEKKQHQGVVNEFRQNIISNNLKYGAAYTPHVYAPANYPVEYAFWRKLLFSNTRNVSLYELVSENLKKELLKEFDAAIDANTTITKELKIAVEKNVPEIQLVQDALFKAEILLPPSAAIAGVYATTDMNRGVWKAPANVAVTGIIKPAVMIDAQMQDDLNIDANAGKSINAIRNFTGKGNLIWGARTLMGNDNEWRYVSVRRFFNMLEKAVTDSCGWVVFEPNDANTWVKLKTTVENFCFDCWRNGALMGAKPTEAFFVQCGLNTTMTNIDILEGRLILQLGLATVRPAEFIITRFEFLMQR